MVGFPGSRISGSLVTALLSVVLLTSGPAAAAQSSDQHALPSSCAAGETKGLNGYQPVLALGYMATIVTTGTTKTTEQLQLTPNKQYAQGDIAGTAKLSAGGFNTVGNFKGTLKAGAIQVKGTLIGIVSEHFSFTGTTSCLLSKIKTTDLTATSYLDFPSTAQFTSECPADTDYGGSVIACLAKQIRDGIRQPGPYKGLIPKDGAIPYSAGGHGRMPGPGSDKGGLDCSGFTRWVYDIAYGSDVLGKGNAMHQAKILPIDPVPGAHLGDIVYWPPTTAGGHGHVGIVIAKDYMLDEPNGDGGHPPHNLRVDRISTFDKAVKHSYHYLGVTGAQKAPIR
jgi:NlpC/P60 family